MTPDGIILRFAIRACSRLGSWNGRTLLRDSIVDRRQPYGAESDGTEGASRSSLERRRRGPTPLPSMRTCSSSSTRLMELGVRSRGSKTLREQKI
ncbi:hypothetical protein Dda_0346 [Drechslerella dactyloides]|uniref:Uncharacterized protein n=1 Tax=Drechslerella dactyloides TaxID=74499 RepID=A0AAD6NP22_DREDA|nr:hypothetical protein Dda_0346 [Drechslerella dactyloides]